MRSRGASNERARYPDAYDLPWLPLAGKSYILNQLAGREYGFGVGGSVQACTKGIWLWGAPIQSQSKTPGAPDYVLLLDTEGLQSLNQTEGHDAKIFCLAILLSSFFIYNSEKVSALPRSLHAFQRRTSRCCTASAIKRHLLGCQAINSAALDQLSLVAQLTKRIKLHAAESDENGVTVCMHQNARCRMHNTCNARVPTLWREGKCTFMVGLFV